jgi:hypothetical protein
VLHILQRDPPAAAACYSCWGAVHAASVASGGGRRQGREALRACGHGTQRGRGPPDRRHGGSRIRADTREMEQQASAPGRPDASHALYYYFFDEKLRREELPCLDYIKISRKRLVTSSRRISARSGVYTREQRKRCQRRRPVILEAGLNLPSQMIRSSHTRRITSRGHLSSAINLVVNDSPKL